MQIVAEYCSDHPSDQGCEFMILRFERTLGEQARIEIHFKGLGPTVEAKFVPEACACDGSCKANEVDVIATSYDAAFGFITVDFVPHLEKTYRLCLAPLGIAYGGSWSESPALVANRGTRTKTISM